MGPSCYYTCSLIPVSLLAGAGYRPARLMPREAAVQSSARSVLTAHSTCCPYVSRLLPAAEATLDTECDARLVVPSGCDAMRRAGELLTAAFPERVFSLAVPRVDGDPGANALAGELERLLAWLRMSSHREPFRGEAESAALGYPSARVPGGVFVVSGPLDGPALLDTLQELGAGISGLESCSSEERVMSLRVPLDSDPLALARAVLDRAVCPRCPASQRKAHLRRRWQECRPGAILYARPSFCDPAAYDLLEVAELAREWDLPFMEVEVGLPLEITGPLRTRLEAFVETLFLDL